METSIQYMEVFLNKSFFKKNINWKGTITSILLVWKFYILLSTVITLVLLVPESAWGFITFLSTYEQFMDQTQIGKKAPECWKWVFQKEQNLKPSNIDLASVFEHVRRKL